MFRNVSLIAQCISVQECALNCTVLSVFRNVSLITQFISVQECVLNCTVYQCPGKSSSLAVVITSVTSKMSLRSMYWVLVHNLEQGVADQAVWARVRTQVML